MDHLNLTSLIKDISDGKLLLPDFQRNFIWKDEMQRKLIASVLTKLPLGSLLLLKSNNNEYRAKKIGLKSDINPDENGAAISSYILDGQQRLTVLVNTFSNTILKESSSEDDLVYKGLKTRYFLKFRGIRQENISRHYDIFGLNNFNFQFSTSRGQMPNFSSGDIIDFIYGEVALKNGAFSCDADFTKMEARDALIDACNKSHDDEFLIPLYLLDDNEEMLVKCICKLVELRKEKLLDFYNEGKIELIKEIFEWKGDSLVLDPNIIEFSKFLDECIENWKNKFRDYLYSCINPLELSTIEIESEDRSRAIDIYENLNIGGISLSSFDLVLAVASITCKNFYSNFIENLGVVYEINSDINKSGLDVDDWSARKYMGVFDEEKNTVSNIYIEVYLNLLSIVNYTEGLSNISNLKMDLIKRDKILCLKAEQINEETFKVQEAINKALSFLQFRCGLVSIVDLRYKHLLLGLSTMYYKYYELNVKQLNILESWYLSSILSGEYDSDQTTRIISDIRSLYDVIEDNTTENISFIKTRIDNVLKAKYFSDKNTLLLKDPDHRPKKVVIDCIVNFILAQGCRDFRYENDLTLYAFTISRDGLKTTNHHIIPLNVGTVGESTKKLRNDSSSKYNSPLNFTIITQYANNKISSNDISTYFKRIPKACFVDHLMNKSYDENTSIDTFLEERFSAIESKLNSHLLKLINFVDSGQ